MNYYPHHIGDFIRETSRLNDSQTMAYLRLIWLYYDSETPLENDLELLAFKIGSDVHTVGLLLKCFFYADGMRWHHKRIDDEISAYKSKSEKAKGSAQARWKKPQNMPIEPERNANVMRTHTESNANQEPITSNQDKDKASNASPRFDPLTLELPWCLPWDSWQRWISYRRERKLTCTQSTMQAQLKKLNAWFEKGQCPTAIIDNAISNGYAGLFPLKVNATPTAPKTDNKALAERLAAKYGIDQQEVLEHE